MVRICGIHDLNHCSDLAYKLNSKPESSSAYCCKKHESIKGDFEAMIKDEKNVVIGYFEEDHLIGVLGLSVDVEKNMADCVGPFIEGDDFVNKAKDMLIYAKAILDEPISFNFFFDKRNKECLNLMRIINGKDKGNECILTLKLEDFKEREYKTNIVHFSPEYTNDFVMMHDSIFPGVYVSSKDILNSLENNRMIFLTIENGAMLGYCVLRFTKGSSIVTVEIIGVDEKYRGKGYGKALLNSVLKQIFGNMDIKTVNLVVENLNTNAMNMYYSFGFELDAENCAYSA